MLSRVLISALLRLEPYAGKLARTVLRGERLGNQMFLPDPCLYGWRPGASHKWYSDRSQKTVMNFDKPQRNGEHPTMKPVALFEYQMCNSTKRGDIVLDMFAGSGTTVIAAERTGRTARVMELDPKYCDVIRRRWAEFVHGEGCNWQALTPAAEEEKAGQIAQPEDDVA